MRIHHFYPKTRNIGDHFVQQGIERMLREIVPRAAFDLFNVNAWGDDKTGYGLTRTTIARANREADLVIVGGSNLYEGNYRWRWGVHLETDALDDFKALKLSGLVLVPPKRRRALSASRCSRSGVWRESAGSARWHAARP